MTQISISAEGLKAFAKEVVMETLKEVHKTAVSKSEYSRLYNVSRVTIDRMIARGELTLNKRGKIIIY